MKFCKVVDHDTKICTDVIDNDVVLLKFANFVSKFKTKHATEEQSQCLEESHNCFESKVAEGFRFIDLNFLAEQLRRDCCT